MSALAGIGGGVLTVPFLYFIYAASAASLSAQTVVAHATSLGVAFISSSIGTWRYARTRAIAWNMVWFYALPGIVAAFITARIITRSEGVVWIRAAFGIFLLVTAADMARRARMGKEPAPRPHHPHTVLWLALTGVVGGVMSSLLGIGGGLVAVPVLLYVGRLPVRQVAPTALAGVCLTTLSGGFGYLTAGHGPALSGSMAGFMDLRMLIPIAAGATLTVPIGVRVNRASSPRTLYGIFAAVLAVIGTILIRGYLRGS